MGWGGPSTCIYISIPYPHGVTIRGRGVYGWVSVYVLGPLGEVVGLTIPLVSPAVTGHLETDTAITVVNHALGVDFVTLHTSIRHTLTLHWTGVVTGLTDTNEVDGLVFDIDHLVVINIGLVIAPATHIDITHINSRKRFLYLGDISSLDSDSAIIDGAVSGATIDSAIPFDFPDLEFGIGRHHGEFINTIDELNVIGDGIVLLDFVSHSSIKCYCYCITVSELSLQDIFHGHRLFPTSTLFVSFIILGEGDGDEVSEVILRVNHVVHRGNRITEPAAEVNSFRYFFSKKFSRQRTGRRLHLDRFDTSY